MKSHLTAKHHLGQNLGRITAASFIALLWGAMAEPNASAQVTSDPTLATSVTTTDNLNFLIDGGEVCCLQADQDAGRNLFHSFDQFSVPTNGSAQFNNAIAIDNIIGRITGTELSSIDGLIQANGNANLFLLNPNGFIFGPNARLDIGGSFLATTANRFLFEDDIVFSTTQPEPLLSIRAPLGIQLGPESGPIEVLGPGHQLFQGNDLIAIDNLATEALGLEVAPRQNLVLIGSALSVDGGVLTAAKGHIELASIRQGLIELDTSSQNWNLTYGPVTQFNDLTLTQSALINTTNRGSVSLLGNQILFNRGSILLSQNTGNGSAGTIDIQADDSLVLRGVNGNNFRSSIQANVARDASETAIGSLINIQAPLLRLRNGAAIRTTTFGPGDSGDIRIQADDSAQVLGFSPLTSTLSTDVSAIGAISVGGTGDAGNIHLRAGRVYVQDGGVISSSTLFGSGQGGNIFIESDSLRLSGSARQLSSAGISAATLGDGNAGNITINTQELLVLDDNIVDSSSAANGDAGDVNIFASERVIVRSYAIDSNPNDPRVSVISSAVSELSDSIQALLGLDVEPNGNAGSIFIETPNLQIANDGFVTINAGGDGNAGQLDIVADTIRLENNGRISATTTVGAGGDVNVRANNLFLKQSSINASTFEDRIGSNISLNLDQGIVLANASSISAQAGEAAQDNSESGSRNGGNGGNIRITSPFIVALSNSDIQANAVMGNGGNITIMTQALLGTAVRDQFTSSSDITASSESGVSGTVSITAPDLTADADFVVLPSMIVDPSQQVATACDTLQGSSFTTTGRGGLPIDPGANGDRPWPNILPDFGSTADSPLQPHPEPIATAVSSPTSLHREATQMAIASNGAVQLVDAIAPSLVPSNATCTGH